MAAAALRFIFRIDPLRNVLLRVSIFFNEIGSGEPPDLDFGPRRLRTYNTFFQKTTILLYKILIFRANFRNWGDGGGKPSLFDILLNDSADVERAPTPNR